MSFVSFLKLYMYIFLVRPYDLPKKYKTEKSLTLHLFVVVLLCDACDDARALKCTKKMVFVNAVCRCSCMDTLLPFYLFSILFYFIFYFCESNHSILKCSMGIEWRRSDLFREWFAFVLFLFFFAKMLIIFL